VTAPEAGPATCFPGRWDAGQRVRRGLQGDRGLNIAWPEMSTFPSFFSARPPVGRHLFIGGVRDQTIYYFTV
jgi:hypothetical protein